MKLVAIYGSPRVNGNSDLMLKNFLEGAATVPNVTIEEIRIRRLNIKGCLSCGYCDTKGTCIQKDDMHKFYKALATCDRIVVASPNYFYSVPGQLKCFIDRTQALFMAQKLPADVDAGLRPLKPQNRKGFFLGVGATKGKRLFDCCKKTMYYFFDAIGVEYGGDYCVNQVDKKGEIKKYPEILKKCREFGFNFVNSD